MAIEVGQEAPDFDLPDHRRNRVKLSDFRGKSNVVLVFYPFTFTGVCTGELCELRDDLAVYEGADAQVLAVSCDTPFAQAKFAEEQGYNFPVLSDFWPHGAVSRAYGVFNEDLGAAMRGSFVIDKQGIVVGAFQSPNLTTPREKRLYEEALAKL
jgi:peroxiredoxin (alkyl hydroperoxide reductase subunit C)